MFHVLERAATSEITVHRRGRASCERLTRSFCTIILAAVLFWVLRHNTGPISQAFETRRIHVRAVGPSLCVSDLGNLACESAIS